MHKRQATVKNGQNDPHKTFNGARDRSPRLSAILAQAFIIWANSHNGMSRERGRRLCFRHVVKAAPR